MARGYNAKYKGKIPDRDIDVLEKIYQLQAVLTRDLIPAYYPSEQTGTTRLIKLHHDGYIAKRRTVVGKGRADGSVCSITDLGIEELVRVGKLERQDRRARDMRLPTQEMLVRIKVSAVAIKLETAGWTFLGGKDGKKQLGLQPTSPMQMVFTTPEGQLYQVYVLNESSLEQTLIKIITELKGSKHGGIILYTANYPTEQTPSYLDLVKLLTEQEVTANELCLIPLATYTHVQDGEQNFAINALLHGGNAQVEQYLRKHYDRFKYSDNRYGFGDMAVEQGGQEYLICNYLWRDRAALRLLTKYLNEYEYRNTGVGAIVLTWRGFTREVRQMIDSVQKRDFIKVEGIEVRDIVDSQAAK